LNWHNSVSNQMLVMDQFKEIPVMLFTSRYIKAQGPGKNPMNFVATESIEKLTGKLKYFKEEMNNGQQQQFTHLNVDLRAGKVELGSWNTKLVHKLLSADGKEKPTSEENLTVPPQQGGVDKSGAKPAAQPLAPPLPPILKRGLKE
jgi:hypothetical protein